MENQRNLQSMSTNKRFVGLIMGPFDSNLQTPKSFLSCFHVRTSVGQDPAPMRLRTLACNPDGEDAVGKAVLGEIEALVNNYCCSEERTMLGDIWERKLPDGSRETCTMLYKLGFSLRSWLQPFLPEERIDAFLKAVLALVATGWDIDQSFALTSIHK